MISNTHYRVQAEVNRQTQLSSDISKLQIAISTGKRIQTASDDPAGAARLAAIRQSQADQAGWSANARAASASAGAADTTLAALGTALARAQELMVSARSATASASDRAAAATELAGIAQDIAGYAAQTDSSGQPLFPAAPLAVPVGDGVAIAATPSRAEVFTIASAGGGSVDLSTFVASLATTLAGGGTPAAATLTTLGNAVTQTADAQAAQGVRTTRLDSAATRLTNASADLKAERNDLEQTDLTQAVAELQAKMTTLQAAQALLVKLSNTNLFSMLS